MKVRELLGIISAKYELNEHQARQFVSNPKGEDITELSMMLAALEEARANEKPAEWKPENLICTDEGNHPMAKKPGFRLIGGK